MRRVNCWKIDELSLRVCSRLHVARRHFIPRYAILYFLPTSLSQFNSSFFQFASSFFRPSREHEQEGSYYDHRWLLIFRSRNTIFVLSQFIYFLENRLWPRSGFVDFLLRFFLLFFFFFWILTSFVERKVHGIGRRRYIYRVTWGPR